MTWLKRKSKTIAVVGNKNQGKSTVMNWYGYLKYMQGCLIFSNQESLRFPYVYVDSLKDLRKIVDYPKNIKKYFLGDDFEFWVNARLFYRNIDINNITILFGKANCGLMFTSKRFSGVDLSLRNTTDEVWSCELIVPYKFDLNDVVQRSWFYEYSNTVERLLIEIEVYDTDLNFDRKMYLGNLLKWMSLFDTQEYIKDLYLSEQSSMYVKDMYNPKRASAWVGGGKPTHDAQTTNIQKR